MLQHDSTFSIENVRKKLIVENDTHDSKDKPTVKALPHTPGIFMDSYCATV